MDVLKNNSTGVCSELHTRFQENTNDQQENKNMTLKKQTGHSGLCSLGAVHAPSSVAVMQQVNAGREKCKMM